MSVVINGATGNIGACTAWLALTLGARKVIGLGRDQEVLEQLRALDSRLHGVQLSGDAQADLAHVQSLDSRIDTCVDASAAHDSASTEVALNSLRSGGVAVWVGGVRATIPVSYFNVLIKELTIRGSYMYGPECPSDLIRMIETGFLQLERIRTHAFALEEVNEAIRFAPNVKGLSAVVIQP